MKRRSLIFLGILCISITRLHAEIYLWPLHGERRLSSSFAEYRDGHYHAGIDLRTYGRTGLPCLAVADGEIRRVKIQPGAYGRALYIRLDDGRTAVYAHLYGFTGEIDSLTYHRGIEHGYWCDIQLEAGRYRVSVGDTIAYTGISGTSAPHLHFELRNEREHPFNPLESLYAVPDGRPPFMSGLDVVPMGAGSLVDGSPLPAVHLFRAGAGGLFVLPDTLHLNGTFGFGVSVWDEQGFGAYKMAPYSIELAIDGKVIHRRLNRIFAYTQTREILLDYDILGSGASDRYTLLFHRPGSTRGDIEGSGLIGTGPDHGEIFPLEGGLHRCEIRSVDAAGNVSRALFHVRADRPPAVKIAKKLAAAPEVVVAAVDPAGGPVRETLQVSFDGGGEWLDMPLAQFGSYRKGFLPRTGDAIFRYEARGGGGIARRWFASPHPKHERDKVFCECSPEVRGGRLELYITTDRALAGAPSVGLLGPKAGDTLAVHRLSLRRYVALLPASRIEGGLHVFLVEGVDYRGFPLIHASAFDLHRLVARVPVTVRFGDTLTAMLEPQAVRDGALCLAGEVPLPGPPPSGLTPVSPAVHIDLEEDRIIRPLVLRANPGGKVGLFRWREEKGWQCVGVPAMEGGTVRIDRPGVYAYMRDGLPPDFNTVAVEEQPQGSGFFKRYAYYVSVREEGAGVDPHATAAYLDGRPIACYWDDLRERLYIPVPASFPVGQVRLKVEIGDRTGNWSVGEYGFVIE